MPETPEDPETVHILGEGGTVFELQLPLHEAITERLAAGQIRRVNADGSTYDGPAEPGVAAPPTEAPKPGANKGDWLAWAVASGADPDEAAAATKQDLIDRYGTPD